MVSSELLLVIAVFGFYLANSAMLLYSDELIFIEVGGVGRFLPGQQSSY